MGVLTGQGEGSGDIAGYVYTFLIVDDDDNKR